MKTILKGNIFKTIFLLTLSIGVISCSSDDDGPIIDDTPDEGVLTGTVLTGEIATDLFVPKGDYTLKGLVFVKDGATLTIEKGSKFTVTATDQANEAANLIMVEMGGKLIADGTATEPIVFTSENKNSAGGDGDWGGIVIHGKAKINGPAGQLSEAGQLPYGGNDDTDNSGILRFVRVEYAGAASSDGAFEYNAFSFFAVGSGTILANCEAYKGADDGFEFYGGSINGSNLLTIGMEDDSIDWDQGYRGNLTNIAVYQLDNVGDFAFELSSRKTEWNSLPRSAPNVSNLTVRGHNKAGKSAFDLKEGSAGIFTNLKIYNFEIGAVVNNQMDQVLDGSLKMNNITISVSGEKTINNVAGSTITNDELATLLFSESANATGADLSAFSGWSNILQVQF